MFGLKPTYGRLSRARSFPFVVEPRSSRPVRAHRRATSRSPMTRCRGPIRTIRVCADRPAEPVAPAAGARHRAACASRSPAAISSKGAFPEALRRGRRASPRRSAPTREIEIPEAARARAAAYVITTTEGARAASRSPAHARRRFRSGGARPADRRRHDPGAAGATARRNSAAGIAREVLKLFEQVDAILAPATPCAAPDDRPADLRARRRRAAGAAEHRHLHAADLVHRPAGRRRAGAARRRCRSACRSSPRPGARTSRCASPMRWSRRASCAAPRPQV